MTSVIILLIVGFILVIKGADLMVDGSVIIAKRLRVSPLVIGLTIVAFGTSAPELVVVVVSALKAGGSDIGLGNIVGSNIANIGLIVGLAAALYPLRIKKVTITRELPLLLLSTVAVLILVSDQVLGGQGTNSLTAGDGAILLLFFSIFLYYLTETVLSQRDGLSSEFAEEYAGHRANHSLKATFLIIIGIAGLIWGGRLVVDNATALAQSLGLSEILIGITIVAIGTSLPELATVVVAAYKKQPDVAVGGIVGSNIFNTFFILGAGATLAPIRFEEIWFIDIGIMIGFSALLFISAATGKKIQRSEGIFLLVLYVGYITFTLIRG